MSEKSTSIYIPIALYGKLQRLQAKLEEILGVSIPFYKVIEILIALQVKEELE